MRNNIIYFYDIKPKNIRYGKKGYTFSDGNNTYLFKESERTIEELYELLDLSNYIKQFNIYTHEIVINKYGNLVSQINNKLYILLKLLNIQNRKVVLEDIIGFFNIEIKKEYRYILRNNWAKLWSESIDYIESRLAEYKDKNQYIYSYVDYNVGLVENAIQLLFNVENRKTYLNHIRIKKNTTLLDLYDPCNIVLDCKSRNLCEYYRSQIVDGTGNIEDVRYELLNENEKKLFFVRFLYNTSFFDEVFKLELSNQKINTDKIVENLINYERAIGIIYNTKIRFLLPEIEWIKKQAD